VVVEDDVPAVLDGLVIDTDNRRRRELAAEDLARAERLHVVIMTEEALVRIL